MDGLIIKKKWLDLILSGKKTLEIRSSSTKKTGIPIYLLESVSKRVRGHASYNQYIRSHVQTGQKSGKIIALIFHIKN